MAGLFDTTNSNILLIGLHYGIEDSILQTINKLLTGTLCWVFFVKVEQNEIVNLLKVVTPKL